MLENEDRTKVYPAKVARVIDEYSVVINRGGKSGIKKGQRFLIYRLDEEPLKDPDTGESLGQLEIVCGVGEVSHVQEAMATIQSTMRGPGVQRSVRRHGALAVLGPESETITEIGEVEPFRYPEVGDLAKPI
jgi:hypothetical protein